MRNIEWTGDNEADIEGLRFLFGRETDGAVEVPAGTIRVAKPAHGLKQLVSRIQSHPIENVVEIGVLQGGSLAFWHRLLRPARCVGLDVSDHAVVELEKYLASPAYEGPPPMFVPRIDQGDRIGLRAFTQMAPGESWIDLVLDDASRQYGPTRRCFEEVFPSLRPGGLYVIEDWAWAHWKDHGWKQRLATDGYGQSLTTLLLQIMAVAANLPTLISRVEVNPGFAVITRGDMPVVNANFNLAQHTVVLGRKFVEMPMPATDSCTLLDDVDAEARRPAEVLDEAIERFAAAERRSQLYAEAAALSDDREAARVAAERHALELTRLLVERSAQLVELSGHCERLSQHHTALVADHYKVADHLRTATEELNDVRAQPVRFLARRAVSKAGRILRRLSGGAT